MATVQGERFCHSNKHGNAHKTCKQYAFHALETYPTPHRVILQARLKKMMLNGKQATVSVARSSVRHARPSLQRRSEPREIGCSELYSMTEAIKGNSGDGPTSTAPAITTPIQPSTSAPVQPSTSAAAAGNAKPKYGGVDYYKGLVMSDLQQDNGSSSADMLKRSLQLAVSRLPVLSEHQTARVRDSPLGALRQYKAFKYFRHKRKNRPNNSMQQQQQL